MSWGLFAIAEKFLDTPSCKVHPFFHQKLAILSYYYYYYYYYYYLVCHSLCWCSFCASAGRKPRTWSRSVTQAHSVYTLSTLLRIRADQQADFLLFHSSSL